MKICVDIAEASERFEELIELVLRDDEIVICRDGCPIAVMTPLTSRQHEQDDLLRLAAEGRANVPPGTTSNHDDFYDEHGLPI